MKKILYGYAVVAASFLLLGTGTLSAQILDNDTGADTDANAGVGGVLNDVVDANANDALPDAVDADVLNNLNVNPAVNPVVNVPVLNGGNSGGSGSSARTSGDVGEVRSSPRSGRSVASDSDLAEYVAYLLSLENGNGQTSGEVTSSGSQDSNAGGDSDGARIRSVEYTDDGMVIGYEQPAKFLGLIPTTLEAEALVEDDGDVFLDYPWYGFLYSAHKDNVKAHVLARVDALQGELADPDVSAVVNADAGAGTSRRTTDAVDADAAVSLTPRAKAMILDEVRGALHDVTIDGVADADLDAGVLR